MEGTERISKDRFEEGQIEDSYVHDLNLIRDPKHQQIAKELKKELWQWLETTNGVTDSAQTEHRKTN